MSKRHWSTRRAVLTTIFVVAGVLSALVLPMDRTASAHPLMPLDSSVGGNTTFATTALGWWNNIEWLAWTGTDSNHHLNIIGSTDDVNWGTCGGCGKVVLSAYSQQYAGPALAVFNGHLYIAYSYTDTSVVVGYLNWTGSGFSSTLVNQTWIGEQSYYTPGLAVKGSTLYIAWTGTDSAGHLNFIQSNDGTGWYSKVTGNDTATDGLGLAYFAGDGQLFVAWDATNG